jgi:hypothetical protein
MTLADERYRSLIQTKKFLIGLQSPMMTPRVPKTIRQQARSLLRHWPDDYHLELITEKIPEHFAKDLEPLYRMIKKYEQDKND